MKKDKISYKVQWIELVSLGKIYWPNNRKSWKNCRIFRK